jgi:hypothetical protein
VGEPTSIAAAALIPPAKPDYRQPQREHRMQTVHVVSVRGLKQGEGNKLPSGAVYRRKGNSLVRTNKPEGGMRKKQRRRARAAAKLAASQSVEQLQADLASEGSL